MFLLKRKSDGKYFRNKGYHQDSCWYHSGRAGKADDPRWVTDPSACKPFATVSGIKNSRGVAIDTPIPYPGDKEKDRKVWDAYWKQSSEWRSKKNRKVRIQWELERFNEKYEVVKIEYKVTT